LWYFIIIYRTIQNTLNVSRAKTLVIHVFLLELEKTALTTRQFVGSGTPRLALHEEGVMVVCILYYVLDLSFAKSHMNTLNLLEAIMLGFIPKLPRKVAKEFQNIVTLPQQI
jgi:hypothetical protein